MKLISQSLLAAKKRPTMRELKKKYHYKKIGDNWKPVSLPTMDQRAAFEKYHALMKKINLTPDKPDADIEEANVAVAQPEAIDHPSHYNAGKIECIDYIEDQGLGFCAGNAVKYIARHRFKGTPAEDLRKAAWYCLRLAEMFEKNSNQSE